MLNCSSWKVAHHRDMRSNVEFLSRNILVDKDNGLWKLNQNNILLTQIHFSHCSVLTARRFLHNMKSPMLLLCRLPSVQRKHRRFAKKGCCTLHAIENLSSKKLSTKNDNLFAKDEFHVFSCVALHTYVHMIAYKGMSVPASLQNPKKTNPESLEFFSRLVSTQAAKQSCHAT